MAERAAAGGGIAPQLFYSRRIGLNQNRVIPIDVGGRITGKVGNTSVGVLNIQQADEPDVLLSPTPATNFTVARVKRDILRRSSIGAIFTNRSESTVGAGSNQAAGIDGAFTLLPEPQSWRLLRADRRRTSLDGDDESYLGRFDICCRSVRRAGRVPEGRRPFQPGSRARSPKTTSSGRSCRLRFSPRPKHIKSVRRSSV